MAGVLLQAAYHTYRILLRVCVHLWAVFMEDIINSNNGSPTMISVRTHNFLRLSLHHSLIRNLFFKSSLMNHCHDQQE